MAMARPNGTLDLLWNLIDQTRPGRPEWEEQHDYPPNPDHRPARIPPRQTVQNPYR